MTHGHMKKKKAPTTLAVTSLWTTEGPVRRFDVSRVHRVGARPRCLGLAVGHEADVAAPKDRAGRHEEHAEVLWHKPRNTLGRSRERLDRV